MIAKVVSLFPLVATLSGCAGLHVRPDADYAKEPVNTMRVAFDQDGDIYPRDESVVPWSRVKMNRLGEMFGRNSFRLKDIMNDGGVKTYTPQYREQLRRAAVDQLNQMLKPGDKLLVLVHGFNEAYKDAQGNFDTFKKAIGPNLPPTLEVHWDGLIIPNDYLGQLSRATFWPNAVLYSNLAGQHGLRHLLRGINKPTDVRVVTYSRGAAVALSAVADPVYDRVFSEEPVAKFENSNIRSLKVGMVAAAVGDGHVRSEASTQIGEQFGRPVELRVGLNEDDIAVRKLAFPGSYGDTRLGTDVRYISEIAGQRWQFLPTKAVVFKHGSEHKLKAYAFGPGDAVTKEMACFLREMDLGVGSCANVLMIP